MGVNFNKAFVLGNVTRQPEVRALPSGQQVTSFSIATNRFYTDKAGAKKQDTEFHNIVAFGKLADTCARYLNKGSLAFIEGRIQTRNWQDTAGVKHWKTEIIATGLQLGPKPAGAGGGSYSKPLQPGKNEEIPVIEENYSPKPAVETEEPAVNIEAADDEIDVKDIPF